MPTEIVDDHHFLRHCEGRLIDRDDNNEIVEIFPEAMALRRAIKEKTLSGSYYEFFPGDDKAKLSSALTVLNGRIKAGVKAEDALVLMNAGDIRSCGAQRDRKLRVLHDPKKSGGDYASIHGMPEEGDGELCALLTALAVRMVVSVSEIKAWQDAAASVGTLSSNT